MKKEILKLGFAALFVGILAGSGAWAQNICSPLPYEGRPCQPILDNCADIDVTEVLVQLGGEGSVGTEDSCSSSPARDAAGNIVEADLLFTWDRDSATAGMLTLTIENVSCYVPPATSVDTDITAIWFNIADVIGSCVLKAATVDGVNRCGGSDCTVPSSESKVWTLGPDTGSGCLGDFDAMLDTQGIQASIKPGKFGIFTLECTGASGLDALTACDIATAPSTAPIGERLAQAAMHFQNSDADNVLSNKVASNCQEPQFVDLASFTAVPGDGVVSLAWSTLLEVDNAGFQVFRRNPLTGSVVQLTTGLIPAEGDIFQGGHYHFSDEAAINGVEYEYILSDIDLRGQQATHFGPLAVANPRNPRIQLIAPEYGASHLRLGARPTFIWEPGPRHGGVLQISTDPTFEDRDGMIEIRLGAGSRSDGVTLNPAWARRMEKLALGNQGVVYWRVIEETLGSQVHSSATRRVGYGVVSE